MLRPARPPFHAVSTVHYRFALLLFVLLAGCQSQPIQRFDGHTGYETSPLNDAAFLIIYTDEAKTSWAKLDDKTSTLCQRLLPGPPQTPVTKVLRRDVFEQVIANPVPAEQLLMAPLLRKNQNPDGTVHGGGSIPQLPLHVKMKKTMTICELAPASSPMPTSP